MIYKMLKISWSWFDFWSGVFEAGAFWFCSCFFNLTMVFFVCGNFRIQEQLRRIKRNEQKEKLQPVKKKKEKPPNNVSGTVCS